MNFAKRNALDANRKAVALNSQEESEQDDAFNESRFLFKPKEPKDGGIQVTGNQDINAYVPTVK